jgi:hypothetical protein
MEHALLTHSHGLKPMGFGGSSAASLLRCLTGGSRPETAPSLLNTYFCSTGGNVSNAIARKIVGAAERTESGIAMEDLKGIRGKGLIKNSAVVCTVGRLANCRGLSCTRPSVPVSRQVR